MEEISSSSPPILYMSLCPLSPHLFYSCPRLLYLSVFPLSVSIPALPLQRYKASQRQGVQLPASAAERQRGIVKGVGVCSTKWNKQKLLHIDIDIKCNLLLANVTLKILHLFCLPFSLYLCSMHLKAPTPTFPTQRY